MKLILQTPRLLYLLVCLIPISAHATTLVQHANADTGTPISRIAPTLPNANHIFNAIHSAMRQWGSSWNHNGMSLFRATVPADTLLYHGCGEIDTIRGMEWLAFEAEHALMFARNIQPPPKSGHGYQSGRMHGRVKAWLEREYKQSADVGKVVDGGVGIDVNGIVSSSLSPSGHLELRRRGDGHACQHSPESRREDDVADDHQGFNWGYLQHYRALRDLNLLYIDGLSAGKTTRGTLDTQDFLLLSNSSGPPVHFPFDEMYRAVGLCNLTQTSWNGRIDGFIRTECGFEILLCEFDGAVGLDRSQRVWHGESDSHQTDEELKKGLGVVGFRLYKAVADRFWTIGGHRVKLDFEDFVTAYSQGELELFERVESTGEWLPRLRNVSKNVLQELNDQVTRMIREPVVREGLDWQSVSDMYVQRYVSPLQSFLLPGLDSNDFRLHLQQLLKVFASEKLDNEQIEEVVDRCTKQFLPRRWNDTLAGRAVQSVASELCDTLVNSLFNVTFLSSDCAKHEMDVYTTARHKIGQLVSWLQWSVWRECSPSCAINEVCVLPIWPITGRIEDRKKPNCKNATAYQHEMFHFLGNDSYWYEHGDLRPPGRKPPEGLGDTVSFSAGVLNGLTG